MEEIVRKIRIAPALCRCPRCGRLPYRRHGIGKRKLREVGILGPTWLEVSYGKYYCTKCMKYFSADMSHIAEPGARYTRRAMYKVVEYILDNKKAFLNKTITVDKYYIEVPRTTAHGWFVDHTKKSGKGKSVWKLSTGPHARWVKKTVL